MNGQVYGKAYKASVISSLMHCVKKFKISHTYTQAHTTTGIYRNINKRTFQVQTAMRSIIVTQAFCSFGYMHAL
jgi:hypothetical protein